MTVRVAVTVLLDLPHADGTVITDPDARYALEDQVGERLAELGTVVFVEAVVVR